MNIQQRLGGTEMLPLSPGCRVYKCARGRGLVATTPPAGGAIDSGESTKHWDFRGRCKTTKRRGA